MRRTLSPVLIPMRTSTPDVPCRLSSSPRAAKLVAYRDRRVQRAPRTVFVGD
jgi:hypothetical protein